MSIPKFFRGDAAFANPALYRLLEKEGYRYAIRIKANGATEQKRLWTGGAGLRAAGAEALKSTLWGLAPAVGTQKTESKARKLRNIHRALDTRGAELLRSWL